MIFTNQQLVDLCDLRLFVDTDADVRFARRIKSNQDMELLYLLVPEKTPVKIVE